MIKLDPKFSPLLLEAVQELMYKVSLQLENHKGQALSQERKKLTKKQKLLEELQHQIFIADNN